MPKNVIIVPEHWNNGQNGFDNADVYLVINADNELRLATVCFTEDKSHWQTQIDVPIETEHEIITFIKSQSPLTAL